MTYQQHTIVIPKHWSAKGFEFYSVYAHQWSHILRDIAPGTNLELDQLTVSGQSLVPLFDHEHKVFIIVLGPHRKAMSFHGLTASEHQGSIPASGITLLIFFAPKHCPRPPCCHYRKPLGGCNEEAE